MLTRNVIEYSLKQNTESGVIDKERAIGDLMFQQANIANTEGFFEGRRGLQNQIDNEGYFHPGVDRAKMNINQRIVEPVSKARQAAQRWSGNLFSPIPPQTK